jgi:hypothetical protein
LLLGLGYAQPLYPEVYGAESGFAIEKLDVVCMHPCLNMLTIVCYGIPKVGVESSMVVQM